MERWSDLNLLSKISQSTYIDLLGYELRRIKESECQGHL